MAGKKLIRNQGGRVEVGPSSVSEVTKPVVATVPTADLTAFVNQYDPESDPDVRVKRITEADLYERARIPKMIGKNETVVSGRMAFPNLTRAGFTTSMFYGWDGLNKLRESERWRIKRMKESHGYTVPQSRRVLREAAGKFSEQDFDPFLMGAPTQTTSAAEPNAEFHPILLGPFSRQQYLYDMLDGQSKAFEAIHHNPIAKAVINLLAHFTLGDGVKVKWASAVIQELWDTWTLKAKWDEKMRIMYRDATLLGEAFIHDPGTKVGEPEMILLDPSTVWEILTNPRNIDDTYYLHRQFPTQYQIPYAPQEDPRTAGMEMPKVSEYVIDQIPPDEWLHVKLNATLGEKRGRSDLYSILGWLKRFKDWFNAAVVRAQISNAFVVWWKLQGSDADVQAFKANPEFTKMPPPGTQWFTNEAAVPNLLTATGGLSSSDKTGEQLLAIIATSINLPPEYLGVSGAAPRATALKRGEPAGKIFEARQQVIREVVSWQCRRFVAAMRLSGLLPDRQPRRASLRELESAVRARKFDAARTLIERMSSGQLYDAPLDESFEVMLAKIEPTDRSVMLKDLTTARMAGVVSQETFSNQVAELLDIHGYNFDEEQQRMADEVARGIGMPSAVGATEPEPDAAPPEGSTADDADYLSRTDGRPKAA